MSAYHICVTQTINETTAHVAYLGVVIIIAATVCIGMYSQIALKMKF